jgi:heptosyltransferase-2
MITNDTGARHVAAAFGIGVVTLFGSTDPCWSRIQYPRERLIRISLPCSPCQLPLCPQPAGPLYHKCMDQITPDMVLQQAEDLLDLCVPSPAGARP